MKDPLKTNLQPGELELWERIQRLMSGASLNVVRSIAVNLLINAIRQSIPDRKNAEGAINEIFGRAKTVLLDQHYDPVTGRRRATFPFTQQIQMPFHVDKDVFPK